MDREEALQTFADIETALEASRILEEIEQGLEDIGTEIRDLRERTRRQFDRVIDRSGQQEED
jgi:hypothetical protein